MVVPEEVRLFINRIVTDGGALSTEPSSIYADVSRRFTQHDHVTRSHVYYWLYTYFKDNYRYDANEITSCGIELRRLIILAIIEMY